MQDVSRTEDAGMKEIEGTLQIQRDVVWAAHDISHRVVEFGKGHIFLEQATPACVDESIAAERRLMLAVLEDALSTYIKYYGSSHVRRHREAIEVKMWADSDESDWPFSFLNICNVVGIDPDYLRGGMKKWETKKRETTGTRRVPFIYFKRASAGSSRCSIR